MRHVCPAAALGLALSFLIPSLAKAQPQSPGLAITNYQFVSEERVTRTQWLVTYRADLLNNGDARPSATATVASKAPAVQVVAGQNRLRFPAAPAHGQVTSLNTFTLLLDRSVVFTFNDLAWSFLNPEANPGPNQTTTVGSTVYLNGGGSTNPSGVGALTYTWVIESKPEASQTLLANSASVISGFLVDAPGTYVVSLTVSNGVESDKAAVTISTVNSPPVANAGPDQTIGVNSTAVLNGGGSSDVDGDPLTYTWVMLSSPEGSVAALSNPRSVNPTFAPDKRGRYVVRLIVNDGRADSPASLVAITTTNTPPVAHAGPNQSVDVNELVQLNASGSTDVDGDALTYRWTFNTRPNGSFARFSNPSAVNPTFTVDRPGAYVAQLIVNDGIADSSPTTVTITTGNLQPPSADAGANQTVVHGAVVTLNGSGSDPQSMSLTYAWSIILRPAESAAELSSTSEQAPTFIADKVGVYVVQLVVSNGYLNSAPATVTITTTNTPPVAAPGSNQNISVGGTATLDGSGSSDADHDPITYSWSFIARPAGSSAVLQGAVTSRPSFTADEAGSYVVQLIVHDGYTQSAPATVMITAGSMAMSLSPNPLNLVANPGTLTLTLSAPAGPGGLPITLSGYDPSVVSVPTGVRVPENSTGVNILITPVAPGSTSILATSGGYQPAGSAIIVTAPEISMALPQTAVGIARTVIGLLTLNAPAPAAGSVIELSASPAGIVAVQPAVVTIPAGETTGTFKVTGLAEGSATIAAFAPGHVGTSQSILAVKLGAIAVQADMTVVLGQTAELALRLSVPAPVDGVYIELKSGDTSLLTVTPSVFIKQGAVAPDAPATVTGVRLGSAAVTATSPGFTGDSQIVKVGAALSFAAQAVSVGAGGVQSASILLSAPAPADGLIVDLSSSDTALATVPASVTIPGGASSADVTISGVSTGMVTITASSTAPNVTGATIAVTVTALGIIDLPDVAVQLGQTIEFPISLSGVAPEGGVILSLSTSNAGMVDILPGSVTVPAGQRQPAQQPQIVGKGLGSALISVSAQGYGSASRQVQSGATIALTPQALSLKADETKSVTLTLSAPAPAGGVSFTVVSDDAGTAAVTSPVTMSAQASSVSIPVSGVSAGSTVIRVSGPNVPEATVTITVTPGADIIMPANLSVSPGSSIQLPISLRKANASAIWLELTSSDPAKLLVTPASITIPAGQTTANVGVWVEGIAAGTATVTATPAGGAALNPASTAVKVVYTVTVAPQTLEIAGSGNSGVINLTLSGPAPAEGIAFSLSSSAPAVATVPAGVTISAGGTSIGFRVNAVNPGSAVIHITANDIAEATANVTVTPAGSVTLAAPAKIDLNQSLPLTVALTADALTPVTVELHTTDPSKLEVSPESVTIPAGSRTPAEQPVIIGKNIGAASVSATAAGLGSSELRTVQVHATVQWISQDVIIAGIGSQESLTLRLNTTAPMDGLTVNLSSSNPDVATIQPTAIFIWDGSTAPGVIIPVTAVGAGTTTIRASGINVAEVTTTVTVVTSLAISTGSLPDGRVNAAYSATVNAAGGAKPYSWSASGLPEGLTIASETGVISGTTESAGAHSVTVTVTDSATPAHASASKQFTLTISAGLSITTPSLPPGIAGQPYSVSLAASGGQTPYVWSASGLPAGLSIDQSSGVISGTPNANGSSTVAVTVTDSANPAASASREYALVIGPALTITTTALPTGQAGTAYSAALAATGGATPYVWSATGLPSGFAIDSGTGVITGPATASGSSTVTVTVTDASVPAQSASKQFQLTIGIKLTTTPEALTLTGGGNTTVLYMALSSPAPAGGIELTLTSTDTNVVTVPFGASISESGSSIGVRVTSVNPGSATIRITSPQTGETVVNVTVVPPGSLTLAAPARVDLNQTGALSIGLTADAVNPVIVELQSSNPAILEVSPATVTIPAGARTPTEQAHVTGKNNGAASVTASAVGYPATAPQVVQVHASVEWVTQGASIFGIGNQRLLTLRLTTTAPTDGLTVNLSSSNPEIVSIQATGTFIWDGSTAPGIVIPVTATGLGTATIHASGVNVADVTTTVTVAGALSITTASLPNAHAGAQYSAPVSAIGGTTPYVWSATGLPSGLTINPETGVISGTAPAAGSIPITVTVTDASAPQVQTHSKSLTLNVVPGVSINTGSLPSRPAKSPYEVTLLAAGGTQPYSWSVSGLPQGLSADSVTGKISGTPAAPGTSTVDVTVSDSTTPALTATAHFTLVITPEVSITTASLPEGVENGSYSATLAATGGTAPYSWAASGLPSGLTIAADTGIISGTAGAPGSSNVSITVTDSTVPARSVTKQFSLVIGAPLSIASTALPSQPAGVPYSFTLEARGGHSPYTWAATGLPAGFGINSGTGVISGNPEVESAGSVNVTVTDAAGQNVSKSLTLTITPGLAITTASLSSSVDGAAYNAKVDAVGGVPPYSWTAGGLPNGLAIDPATGIISGTPSGSGSSTVTVTVADAPGATHRSISRQFTLTIVPKLAITSDSLAIGSVGSPYSSTPAATGGTPPYSWSATGLPSGFEIAAATGVITGNAQAPVTATVTVTVADAPGVTHQSASKTFTLTIAEGLVITTPSLPSRPAGSAYSAPLQANGGIPPYSWSATALPPTFALDAVTGVISGNPTEPSTSEITVTVSDSTPGTHQTATRKFTLNITARLSITTASPLPSRPAGSPYSASIAATGGTPPYSFTASGLPANLTINSTTGAIGGVPAAEGSSSVTVTVTDSTSGTPQTAQQQFALTITPELTIATASLAQGFAGVQYNSAPMAAAGGTAPLTWTASGLPPGFSINSGTGVITGMPAEQLTAPVTVTVTDSTAPPRSVSRQYTLTIGPALAITTAALASRPAGIEYSATLAATGGTTPYHWAATGLPADLVLNPATGVITGIPNTVGESTVNVTVTDSTGPTPLTASRTFTLAITPRLSITTTELPSRPATSPYNFTVQATGGTQPYSWSATGLPSPLTMNASTGEISGTPATHGSSDVTITVTDATNPSHQSVTTHFTLTITPRLTIETAALPARPAGASYSAPVTAAGGTAPYAWSASGLPEGFSIDPATGVISGTPLAASSSNITVTVTDATNPAQSASKPFVLTITPGLTITTSSLPSQDVGAPYSAPVSATGGTPGYTWSAANLPSGFSIGASTGIISGNPATAMSVDVTVTVTDSTTPTALTASRTLHLEITQGLAITTTAIPPGEAGLAYSFTMSAIGGTKPYTWSAADLPRGLFIDPLTGVIGGTPSAPGTITATISVADASHPDQPVSKSFAFAINRAPLLIMTASPLPDGQIDVPYSTQLVASGGLMPYNWTATGLPSGLTIDQTTGEISGMTSVPASLNITATVTDYAGTITSKQLQLFIGTGGGTGVITVSGVTVGQNLQVPVTITITPAPTSNVTISIVSSSPNLLLGSPDVGGSSSLEATISGGTNTISTYAKALAGSGTATITARIAGYREGSGTVTFAPSGFVLAGPNGIGASFNAYQRGATTLTVHVGELDSVTKLFVKSSEIRGGYSISVPLASVVTDVGTVSPESVTFTGGMSSATATFQASSTNLGATTLTAGAPYPFATPATGSSLVATVLASGVIPCNPTTGVTVGKNLQARCSVSLTSRTTAQVPLTITSSDETRLKFSTTPDGPTSKVIALTIPASQIESPDFYVHSYAETGSASYTAAATGYGSVQSTVNFARSGLVVVTPAGANRDFAMSLGPIDATLTLYTARLDGGGTPVAVQNPASGLEVPITVVSSTPSVGTITQSPLTLSAVHEADTGFHAVGAGVTTVTASAPGFESAVVQATVQSGGRLLLPGLLQIGKNLQDAGYVVLPAMAPAGGVTVTVRSNSPSLQLAATSTGAGAAEIQLEIPSGQQSAEFYVHALASEGTETYTASADGFQTSTGTVEMAPSGIVIMSMSASISLSGPPETLYIMPALLGAGATPLMTQGLAGGQPLVVNINNSQPSIGTVASSVTIEPGWAQVTTLFTPTAVGITSVSVVQPVGWTTPSDYTMLNMNVH